MMDYAHHLTEVNISPKFNENLSKSSGDMEWTQKCYGWTDRQTDRLTDRQTDRRMAILITHLPLCEGGLLRDRQTDIPLKYSTS